MEEVVISADSHVIEVPDLWEKGMPEKLRERAPRVYFDDKRDAWMFGSAEVQTQAVGGLFMAGQRPENVENFRRAGFSVARPSHEGHGARRGVCGSALSESRPRPLLRERP
jgi:hypothetical protein